MRLASLIFTLIAIASPLVGASQPVALQLDIKGPFQFIAFGDTRFTDPTKRAASDPDVRNALVARLAELHPRFILHSGDLVLQGDNAADWSVWDRETAPWTNEKLSVYPTIGNHELYKDADKGMRNYFRRFPGLKNSRYYSVRAANILILVLDSSQDEAAGPQGRWLAGQLDQLPPEVNFVFFLLHHPPYTNSKDSWFMGGHSTRAPEQALARMLEDRQLKVKPHFIVFSGHVHNYERYAHHGVTYIVTGGGGATPYAVSRGPEDDYREPGPTYHYCTVDVNGPKIEIDMMKLDQANGQIAWRKADSVVIISAPSPDAKAASAK